MDFKFFESLRPAEANGFLESFLREEAKGFDELVPQLTAAGLHPDFSIDSISGILDWILQRLKTVQREPDESVPSWIRTTDTYAKGLFAFDEPSKVLVLRAAYYFGESFRRSSDKLHWGTGDTDFATGNMPVVRGFAKGKELPAMMVAHNLFRRIIRNRSDVSEVVRAVEAWRSNIPEK